MTRNWHDCYQFYCSLNKNFAILVSQSVHQRNLMHFIEHDKSAEPGAIKDLVIMETDTVFLSLIAYNLRRKSRSKDHKWVIGSIRTNNYIASSGYWRWCIYFCENRYSKSLIMTCSSPIPVVSECDSIQFTIPPLCQISLSTSFLVHTDYYVHPGGAVIQS